MAATQRPIAVAALEDKASRAGWKTIPSWTLVTLDDLAVPAESQRFMAAARSHRRSRSARARRHGVRAKRGRRPDPRGRSRNPALTPGAAQGRRLRGAVLDPHSQSSTHNRNREVPKSLP